jgi:hypothetical protein
MIIRTALVLTCTAALSGCMMTGWLSGTGNTPSSGSGSTSSGGSKSSFDDAFAKAQGLGPTTTPLSGTATYNGRMHVLTGASADTGSITGDVEMTADFGSGTPFSATARNFAGTVEGAPVTYSGTLSSAQATDSSPINSLITSPLPPIAGGGESSSLVLSIGGTLTNDDTGVNNTVNPGSSMNANFYGPDGKAVAGAVAWNVTPDGTSAITGSASNASVGGQWYATK